jgi:hypothetical protein
MSEREADGDEWGFCLALALIRGATLAEARHVADVRARGVKKKAIAAQNVVDT